MVGTRLAPMITGDTILFRNLTRDRAFSSALGSMLDTSSKPARCCVLQKNSKFSDSWTLRKANRETGVAQTSQTQAGSVECNCR
mmetsp:Transcript_786/g.1182  ORF Transcript_786/g.1182 Transcript_786/m.1182 type:complete len:84 (-) Transcript_786:617-868(-)